jgi:hypothetical protein
MEGEMDQNAGVPGSRRIDAAEANRMAQEIDNEALGIDAPIREVPTENRVVGDTVESTPAIMEGRPPGANAARPFPPEVDGNATIGGDAESQAVLRIEESR